MRARERIKRRRGRSGPLLTPLIDIIFLLVLFFMINTSFREERFIDVTLPESSTGEEASVEGLVVMLRADGSTAVNGVDIPWESLSGTLREQASQGLSDMVIVQADETVAFGKTVALLDRIREAGLEAASLETLRAGQSK
ncbi:MAG: biopolymer transporter ExbD [Spirochaetales bacterium]|nr:biopolymer transporter ExbD [Spirochaetales bacterium]